MKDQMLERLSELAVNNVAALLLGVSITLWYIYVKHRIDDHAREAQRMLTEMYTMLRHFYDKSNKR
jgi:hypothetical protein